MKVLKFVGLFFFVLIVLGVSLCTATYLLLPKIENPVSILILGKGGEGHAAPNLTDTIMLTNINPNSKKITTISLPRDIWIPAIRAKINTAYHYGGFEMASDSVFYLTGIKPSYYLVLDFSIFKELVDSIGGIEVDVVNSFVDERYPIEGKEDDLCDGDKFYKCRYETINFEKGIQKMNGETALKFVRSRNAIGDEGTDLAREARQQKVIEAIKNKLLSKDVLLNSKIISNLYNVVSSHIETNIDKNTAISLIRLVFESRDNIHFLSIPENFIKISQNDKKYDYQYVFIPTSGNWSSFTEWIKNSI
ncbi:MAG TPA: LCP family protein [Patescibacteria group bacterium]|nr:LCP family protein [Patescibacteria group bacterium]